MKIAKRKKQKYICYISLLVLVPKIKEIGTTPVIENGKITFKPLLETFNEEQMIFFNCKTSSEISRALSYARDFLKRKQLKKIIVEREMKSLSELKNIKFH